MMIGRCIRGGRQTLLLCRRACTALCMADFPIYSLHHGRMEADLRISIKDCRHKENSNPFSPHPVTHGVCLGAEPSFFRQLARNKLIPDPMDTMLCKILVAVQIFAAGNVAYFEIRRFFQFLRANFNKSKSSQNHQTSSIPGSSNG